MSAAAEVSKRLASVNEQISSHPQRLSDNQMLVPKLAQTATRTEHQVSYTREQRPSFVTSGEDEGQVRTNQTDMNYVVNASQDAKSSLQDTQAHYATTTTQYVSAPKGQHIAGGHYQIQGAQYSTSQNAQYSTAQGGHYPSSQGAQYSTAQGGQYSVQGGGASQHTIGSQQQARYISTGARQHQTQSSLTRETETRQQSGTRVIGRETGPHRIVSVTERVDETRSQIMNERTTQHEIRVPRRILREEIIEKVIIVPEKKLVEEFVDEIQMVKETIIEVAKPTIVEKIIEVPEIEIVERIVEVPEKRIEERIVQVEKVIEQQRTVGEPEVIYIDKVVDVPVPEERYRDVEKIIEVPEWHDEIVTKEVRVPVYVDVPVARQKAVPVPVDVNRDLPVPVEAEVTYEYRLPQLKPRYAKVTYPVYLPRFIEIPVAAELLNPELIAKAQSFMSQVNQLTESKLSLCEIEKLAASIIQTDFNKQIASADLQVEILKAWHAGSMNLTTSSTRQALPPTNVVA